MYGVLACADAQQLGRGAKKIQLDGGAGNVNIPGTLSVTGSTTCGSLSSTSLQVSTAGIGSITMGGANQSGQIAGASIDHAHVHAIVDIGLHQSIRVAQVYTEVQTIRAHDTKGRMPAA